MKRYRMIVCCTAILVMVGLLTIMILCKKTADDNTNYLVHTIGAILISHKETNGAFPFSIEEALVKGDLTLAHRGDVWGGNLQYRAVSKREFFLLSAGENGVSYDDDDLTVVNYEGAWYIADDTYIKTVDERMMNAKDRPEIAPPSGLIRKIAHK